MPTITSKPPMPCLLAMLWSSADRLAGCVFLTRPLPSRAVGQGVSRPPRPHRELTTSRPFREVPAGRSRLETFAHDERGGVALHSDAGANGRGRRFKKVENATVGHLELAADRAPVPARPGAASGR